MSYFPYNADLAGAIVAKFVTLAGGAMDKIKLVKLMYLLDRTAIIEEGYAIVGGRYFSLPYGPVISEFLDDVDRGRWDDVRLNGTDVTLVGTEHHAELLSEWVEELAERVYAQYGGMPSFDLVDILHRECKEWEDPAGSSKLISISSIPGCEGEEVEAYARELEMMTHR